MTDPTDDPFELELAASMRSATEGVRGDGVTRAGLDERAARWRAVQRRRLGVAAAAIVLVATGGAVAVAARDESPASVRTSDAPVPTGDAPDPSPPATAVACPPVPAGVGVPGLVQLREEQIQALIAAEQVDPATVFQARRGPVPLAREAVRALTEAGTGLDGEQLLWMGYDAPGIEYERGDDGVYVGYVCPDGSEHHVATTSPPATTTSTVVDEPVTTTSIGTELATTAPVTSTTTPPILGTTTIPAGDEQVLSAELVEGQQVWAVYVRAISSEGPPIDGHDRAGLWEDLKFDSMAVLLDAANAPEITPLSCDGPAAAALLPVLPGGPADASPESVSAMGAYFVDEPAARRAAERLGDEVLVVAPVTAGCVDSPGPYGYRR